MACTSLLCVLFAEDLANQIAFSKQYVNLMQQLGQQRGMYLSPLAAEWFSGLKQNGCHVKLHVHANTYEFHSKLLQDFR